jgi:hypothetical protein
MMLGEPCPNCLLPRTDDRFCEGCGFDFENQAANPAVTQSITQPVTQPVTQQVSAPPVDIEEQIRLAEEAARAASAGPANQNAATLVSDPQATLAQTQQAAGTGTGTGRWTLVVNADRDYYDAVVADGEIDANGYPFPPFCPERRFALLGDNLRIGRSSATKGAVEIDLTGPPTDPGVSHLNSVLQLRPDGGWTISDPGSTNGTVLNDDTAAIPRNQAVPVEEGFRIHMGVWTTLTLVRE